jgi:hypothetical protein
MTRRIVQLATVLFGIMPATLALLANALYYLRGFTAIPEGVGVTVIWSEVIVLCLVGIAGVAGYVALFFAARARISARVAIALLLGVGAMVYAIALGLTPYWLGSPAIVGAAHAASYFIKRRSAAQDRPPARDVQQALQRDGDIGKRRRGQQPPRPR